MDEKSFELDEMGISSRLYGLDFLYLKFTVMLWDLPSRLLAEGKEIPQGTREGRDWGELKMHATCSCPVQLFNKLITRKKKNHVALYTKHIQTQIQK